MLLWKNHSAVCAVVMLLGVLGLALGRVSPTHAAVINCGDVLGPGGLFQLEEDLTCSDFRQRGITIRDGAILNLNGHRVTCSRLILGCIVLQGQGAQLWNGTVDGVLHESIVLEGTGHHTVWNVTSLLADYNVIVESDHNRLIQVSAFSVYSPAIHLLGQQNQLLHSTAHCPLVASGACITVSGDDNRLMGNTVVQGPQPSAFWIGIAVDGDRNVLQGNHILGEGPGSNDTGLVVSGTGNVLLHNRSEGNQLDVEDLNGDCTHNTWRFNTFVTSDPACIGARGGRDHVATK
jgi:hypothetical protein